MLELIFPFLSEQGQAGTRRRDFAGGIKEIVFAIAKASLGCIVEDKVIVMLAVMPIPDNLDAWLLQSLHD